MKKEKENTTDNRTKQQKKEDKYYYASQWSLMARKFRKHKLAMASTILLLVFYIVAIFGSFVAPQGTEQYDGKYVNCGPTPVHLFHEGKFVGPFVYGLKADRDPETFMLIFTEDTEQVYKIKFFTQGDEGGEYKFLGLIPSNCICLRRKGTAGYFCSAQTTWGVTCSPVWCWVHRYRCSFRWSECF